MHRRPPPGGAPPPRQAPIGYRGPAAGPRVNLDNIDVGPAAHNLYVKITSPVDADHEKSRALTIKVLQYVHNKLGLFAQMGLRVKVNQIKSTALQNGDLRTAMKKRGILSLPALTTPNNVYLGFGEIFEIYEKNIAEFQHVARRGERAVEGAVDEDDVDSFYRDEMTFERADEDAQEDGIGETGDMMDNMNRMIQRREESMEQRRGRRPPAKKAEAAGGGGGGDRGGPPAGRDRDRGGGRAGARPDNVRRPRQADPEDEEYDDTIQRLASDIDDNLRASAHSTAGGDSHEDPEGKSDAADDLMEKAYWANQMDSTAL